MGGQACVFYGAAEFSRDADLAILLESENLQRLETALKELQARRIAIPPFEADYLARGHAVHFRCFHPEVERLRVDVMARMRGVEAFPALWERRTTLEDGEGGTYELLSLPDLVRAKKTQRSKDWPMLQRLLEAHYFRHHRQPTETQIRFWLRELRTPELLIEAVKRWPEPTAKLREERPLLEHAVAGNSPALETALWEEERAEKEADRRYWAPLKAELERLRHA
jgi:hypothetical protein